jgi:NAD(P)-dependent dehydrogenase (short-subunit alcohol dehydrogenase family)
MQITNETSAVVTGGASGLGQATARALAHAGAKVAIFDINAEAGEAVAKDIGGVFCNVNIMSEDSCVAGFEKARKAHGQERITVHCAMTAKGGKTLSWDKENARYKRLPTEDYAFGAEGVLVASYRIASLSALGMTTLPELDDGERGAVILTASVAAEDGQIGQVVYGSCKAGVNGLVLPMARDLMDVGIRINAIMPGIFATPLMLRASDKVLTSLAAAVPFPKRLGKPEEYASLALELARNTYFNGQCIRLDGGIRMAPR